MMNTLHQTYESILTMPYYDVYLLIDKVQEINKEEQKHAEQERVSIESSQREMNRNMQMKQPEIPKMNIPEMKF